MRIRAALVSLALLVGGVVAAQAAQAAPTTGTAYIWTGTASDQYWTVPQNWSPVGVPGNGDSVTIAPPSDDHCNAHVTNVPSGVTLQNFSLADKYYSTTTSVCAASISGGSLSVSGSFNWSAGQIDTPMTLLSTSTGTVHPVVNDTSDLTKDLTVQGTLTLDGNVTDGDELNENVALSAGTHLTVAANATLRTQNSNDIVGMSCCTDPGRIVNNGTIDAKDDLTIAGVELDQNGVLDAETATTHVVSLRAPNTAAAGASYTGAGSYRVTQASATDTLSGTQTLGPDFRFILGGNPDGIDVAADGNEALHGTFTLGGTGQFQWAGGHVSANLTLAHSLTTVLDGDVTGDARSLDGTDDPVAGGTGVPATLTNHGVVTFAAAPSLGATDDAQLVNSSDGTLSIAPGTAFTSGCCDTYGTVVNSGGTVSVPAGNSTDPVVFSGFGYRSTGGSTQIAAGRTIRLQDGSPSLLASTTVSGGVLEVVAPLTVSQTVTLGGGAAVHLLPSGSIEDVVRTGSTHEAATLSGAGSLAWTGGTIKGALTVSVTGVSIAGSVDHHVARTTEDNLASTLTLASPVSVATGTSEDEPNTLAIETGCTVNLLGASTWRAHDHVFGGTLANSATMTVQPGAKQRTYVTGGANFTNRGTVSVTSGTLALDNDYRQTAGATVPATGAHVQVLGSSSVVRIYGGSLLGTGSFYGPVNNYAGAISPSGYGALTVHGAYYQASGARAYFDVHGSTRDRITVYGSATVRGTLIVRNHSTPSASARVGLVSATGRVTASPKCTVTSGPGSTGTHARHWSPYVSGHWLDVRSVAGRHTHC